MDVEWRNAWTMCNQDRVRGSGYDYEYGEGSSYDCVRNWGLWRPAVSRSTAIRGRLSVRAARASIMVRVRAGVRSEVILIPLLWRGQTIRTAH